MEENNQLDNITDPPDSPRFDRSDLLSILAVVASLVALGISIYEASILREQSALMHKQQRAAVWPYMEMSGSYMYNEGAEVLYSFKNKGVGPAKINSFKLTINGKEFSDFIDLKFFFMELMPGAHDLTVVSGELGGVVAANEEVQVFKLIIRDYPDAYEVVQQLDFQYEVCYCSIYEDCWYVDRNTGEPLPGCK